MSNIVIKTVSNNKELKEFIRFHTELYKDSPTDIPYLEMGEIDTLRSDKNPAFAFCEAEYYIAYRDGKPVGRIAAIINKRANETWGLKAVRFGWFDFIDDIEVSTALINKVKEYGRARGLENIIGPLGFTDMDREGLQVSGFDYMASMHSNHNFAYYQEHMEKMGGFTKENDWVQLEIKVPDEVPEKFAKVAAMIEKRYNLRARKMTKKELEARNEIKWETYTKKIQIEARIFGDLSINHIIPQVVAYQTKLAQNVAALKTILPEDEFKTVAASNLALISEISQRVKTIEEGCLQLTEARKVANKIASEREKAIAYHDTVEPLMGSIRYHIDKLEAKVDDEVWTLPKYRELLFIR